MDEVTKHTGFRIVLAYFKTFNKIYLSELIPFFYTLVLPLGIFLFNSRASFNVNWTLEKVLDNSTWYLSYIILIIAVNGIGNSLIAFRENGFLKTYTMISGGNKKYPVLGLFLNQLLYGYICTLLFGIGVFIVSRQNLFSILGLFTLIYFVAAIPVYFASFIFGTLKVRSNTWNTIANIGMIVLLTISAARSDAGNLFGELIYGLDPADFVTQVVLNLSAILFGKLANYNLVSTLSLIVVFLVIGFYSFPRIKLNSVNMRN